MDWYPARVQYYAVRPCELAWKQAPSLITLRSFFLSSYPLRLSLLPSFPNSLTVSVCICLPQTERDRMRERERERERERGCGICDESTPVLNSFSLGIRLKRFGRRRFLSSVEAQHHHGGPETRMAVNRRDIYSTYKEGRGACSVAHKLHFWGKKTKKQKNNLICNATNPNQELHLLAERKE